jgi:hypothetical protein
MGNYDGFAVDMAGGGIRCGRWFGTDVGIRALGGSPVVAFLPGRATARLVVESPAHQRPPPLPDATMNDATL